MKKFIVLLVCFSLIGGSVSFAFAEGFKDTNDSAVQWAKDNMLLNGYNDGTFQPDKPVTRAELTVILSRLHSPDLKAKVFGRERQFNDLDSVPWAERYINYMGILGLVNGYEDKTFKPNKQVTWAEALTVLMRIVDGLYNNQEWPKAYVEKASELRLTLPSNMNKPLTRRELADLLYEWNAKDMEMKKTFNRYAALKTIEQTALMNKNKELMKILIYTDFQFDGINQNITSFSGLIKYPELLINEVFEEFLFIVVDIKDYKVTVFRPSGTVFYIVDLIIK